MSYFGTVTNNNMKKSTAIRKILEEDFKSVCDKMVASGDIKNLNSDELYIKYINCFIFTTLQLQVQNSTNRKSMTTPPTKKKRTLTAQQIWSKEDEAKELIKDYCKKNPKEEGKCLPYMSGVHALWKELPTEVQDKYKTKAQELKASA